MLIFSAGIAFSLEQDDFGKSGGPKLIQEGHAFLGPSDSGKPVGEIGLRLGRERFF